MPRVQTVSKKMERQKARWKERKVQWGAHGQSEKIKWGSGESPTATQPLTEQMANTQAHNPRWNDHPRQQNPKLRKNSDKGLQHLPFHHARLLPRPALLSCPPCAEPEGKSPTATSFCASDPLFMPCNTGVKNPLGSPEACAYSSGMTVAQQPSRSFPGGVSEPPAAEKRGTASLRGWLYEYTAITIGIKFSRSPAECSWRWNLPSLPYSSLKFVIKMAEANDAGQHSGSMA